MTNRSTLLALPAAFFALAAHSPAAAAPLDIPVASRTLDNGLRVVVAPNHLVPTVAVSIHYDVGSAIEAPGHTGFAHLFEHMMFEGTAHVGKMEHFAIVAAAGGICNGSTGPDQTQYWESLPRNAFELGLWLEADRMTSLDLSEPNFENQRSTVIQERQQSYDNQPYVPSFLRLDELAYQGYFPYEHSVIGDRADLDTMPFADTVAFFHDHYVPRNAVLVVAGDIEPEDAFAAVERYFGKIPGGDPAPFVLPELTPTPGEISETLVDPLAPLPAFHVAYRGPTAHAPDFYALDLLATWLTEGETAPLYRDLVKERGLAQELDVSIDERRGPALFSFFAVCAPGHDAPEVRRALDEWIDRLAAEGLTEEALQRAKNLRQRGFLESIRSNLRLANELARYQIFYGDASLLFDEPDRYAAVTVDDVRRAVATWLRRDNRVVLDVNPAPAPPAEPPPAEPPATPPAPPAP